MSVDTNAVRAVADEAEAPAEPPETGDSPYPPAPWRLRGWAVQSLHLVDIAAVRPILPPGLRIVPVAPGRTLGCTYVAGYGPGSVLEYHELIVLPALTWRAGRIGFWVSHIYVDHPASAAGGRAVWNLPKELADFSVEEGGGRRRVEVSQSGRRLLGIESGRARGGLPLRIPLPAFGTLDGTPRFFTGWARSRLGLAGLRVDPAPDGPFAGLGLGRPFLGLSFAGLDLLAAAPKSTVGGSATR